MAQPKLDVATLRRVHARDDGRQACRRRASTASGTSPQYGDADVDRLQLLAQVLGGSKSSRLDKRLVLEDKLVDSVSASA